ncbi:hypothetical protein HYT25_03950 [Candidatus Pacearchaeota archaeon]|nr:hypothetical protein [Candidatus Pacearchaeota archaeon]
MSYKNSKKGQVAETTTWIVATVIIIVILTISVYAASILSEVVKTIDTADSVSFLKEQRTNIFLKESLFAFALTKSKDGKNIYSQVENENKLNDFASGFAIEIFKRVHNSPDVISIFLRYNEQNYNVVSYGFFEEKFKVVEKIKINKDSALELVLHLETGK